MNTFEISNEENKKRIKHNHEELIIELAPGVLDNTILSENGVKNILSTMFATLLEEGPDFSIYVQKSNALILATKERVIEHKTVINVHKIIDTRLYINSGLFTHKIEDM